MERPQTVTHLWTDKFGKKTPVQLLELDHLQSLFKLCWNVVYYYEKRPISSEELTAKALATAYKVMLPFKVAKDFSIIFEEELKRRKKRLKRPNPDRMEEFFKNKEGATSGSKQKFHRILHKNQKP